MKLVETIIAKPIFEETQREKLPDGVLIRITYPICDIGKLNANKRMYEDAVWDGVMKEKDLKEKLEKRALFGHAEHPEQTQSNLEKTSHVIFEMWKDDEQVYQKLDIVDTPCGRIVDTLLRAECQVGVSTRAEGDLEEAEDNEGNIYHRVVPERYKYVTTDFTADPSTFGAIPIDIKRNVVNSVAKEAINKEAKEEEREFARLILESMKCGKKDKCQKCGCCEVLEEVARMLGKKELTTENVNSERQYIMEGTWALPNTITKARKLAKLMEEPLSSAKAVENLGHILGDDELWDDFKYRRGEPVANDDVRPLIKRKVKQYLEDYEEEPKDFTQKLDPEAKRWLENYVIKSKTVESLVEDGVIKIDSIVQYNNQKMKVTNIEKVDETVSSITISPDVEGKEVRVENDIVRISGNPYVSIEADGTITIMPVQFPPQEEMDKMAAAGPLPIKTEPTAPEVSSEEELEVPKEEIPESRIPAEGSLTSKIALGNMLRDKENKYWVVREVRGTGLLVSSFGGSPGDQKFVEWDNVGNLGLVKVGEKKIEEKEEVKGILRPQSVKLLSVEQLEDLKNTLEKYLSLERDISRLKVEADIKLVTNALASKRSSTEVDEGLYRWIKKGKHLGGPYGTKSEAEKRLAQVEKFKHMKEESKVDEQYRYKAVGSIPTGMTSEPIEIEFLSNYDIDNDEEKEKVMDRARKEMMRKGASTSVKIKDVSKINEFTNVGEAAFYAGLKDEVMKTTKWKGKKESKDMLEQRSLVRSVGDMLQDRGYEVNYDILSDYIEDLSDEDYKFLEQALATGNEENVVLVLRNLGFTATKKEGESEELDEGLHRWIKKCPECGWSEIDSEKEICPECGTKTEEIEKFDKPDRSEVEKDKDLDESKAIKKLYGDAGLTPPDGKGIHTMTFHKCVVGYAKKIKSGEITQSDAYKRCMGALGPEKAVKKAHRKSESIEVNETRKSEVIELLKQGKVVYGVVEDVDNPGEYLLGKIDDLKEYESSGYWDIVGVYSTEEEAEAAAAEAVSAAEKLAKEPDSIVYLGVVESRKEVNEGFRTDLKNKDKKAILQKMSTITDKLLKGEKISGSEKIYWDAYHAEVSKLKSESRVRESISTTTKEIKDLKVKEAFTRAERDKALELLEELNSNDGSQRSLENKMLISKVKRIIETRDIEVDALRAKLEEKAKLVSELREKVVGVERELTTVKVNLVTDIRQLEEATKVTGEKHLNEIKQLKDEYAKEVEQLKQQHNESIKQIEDNFNKEVKEEVAKAREEVKGNFVKCFTMLRLEESGLSVDDNSQALLEKCESLEEVDDLFEEILDTSRRSALHSEVVKGVKISPPKVDPEQAEADRRVGEVFKGMNG